MKYQELLQTAFNKGYKPYFNWTFINKKGKDEWSLDYQYQEACAMQKWFRDEHKVYVEVKRVTPHDLKVTVTQEGMELVYGTLKFSVEQYTEALLDGITEALKLI